MSARLHLHYFENGGYAIFSDEDELIVDCAETGMGEVYARRLVNSWNACRGLSDEMLTDDCFEKMRQDRDQLLAQCRELAAEAVNGRLVVDA